MKRASSARGHLRDEISELIVEFYKIKLETGRKKVRKENEQHIHYLMEGSPKRFCYKVRHGICIYLSRYTDHDYWRRCCRIMIAQIHVDTLRCVCYFAVSNNTSSRITGAWVQST